MKPALRVAAATLVFVVLALAGRPAWAQSHVGPYGFVCQTPMGPAVQGFGASNFWAHAGFMPGPTIVYGPMFQQLPHFMQIFTQDHECGHLNGAQNEYQANCWALARLYEKGGNQQTVMMIRQYHYGIAPLPPQYGGSGAAFWQGTYQTCPQLALQP
jgi:hypothetical protein